MKKFLILGICVLLLSGCWWSKKTTPNDLTQNIETQKVKTAGLGEKCGGTEKKQCSRLLECNLEGDSLEGKCIDSVVDKKVACPKDQKPVCASKNEVNNAYLNQCEAERHGATYLYDGFCKKNDKVKGNCKAFMEAVGTCQTVFTGYEFNDGDCNKVEKFGCEADMPFETKESCVQTCINGIPLVQEAKPADAVEVNNETVRVKMPNIQLPETKK